MPRGARKKFRAEDWPKQCPNCGRPTIPPKRCGVVVDVDPKLHAVIAELLDGTCCRCSSGSRNKKANGQDKYGRPLPAKLTERADRIRSYKPRQVITDEEIEAAREGLRNMLLHRRVRGIPPEGLDPAKIGNGGLYSSQIR